MSKVNSRNKGHSFERYMRKRLEEIGFSQCKTSRYANRELDDLKVDFVGTKPFNIQAKAVERGINYHSLLKEMPDDSNYNIVIHKKNRQGIVVAMSLDDFMEIIDKLVMEGVV